MDLTRALHAFRAGTAVRVELARIADGAIRIGRGIDRLAITSVARIHASGAHAVNRPVRFQAMTADLAVSIELAGPTCAGHKNQDYISNSPHDLTP